MKKEELLYQYAYDSYKEQLARKREIRDRSSFFFGLGTPAIISIASISLASNNPFSCIKIILLLFSGLLYVASLVFFLLIFVPSNQKSYKPSQLISESPDVITSHKIKEYLRFQKYENTGNDEDVVSISEINISDARTYLGLRFFSNVYSTLFQEYENTHKKFKWFFSILAISLWLSLMLLAISLAL